MDIPIPFVRARNYRQVGGRKINLIVLHDMEAPEKGSTAEAVANYFHGSSAPMASAHYCIDNNSIVQCVSEGDVAYGAPGSNNDGIHLEHAGYASQSKGQWLDSYGVEMLALSAELTGELLEKYDLPCRYVDVNDLLAGGSRRRGITTHANVTRAFHQSTHTDPGRGFPLDYYLDLIKGDTMALSGNDWKRLEQMIHENGVRADAVPHIDPFDANKELHNSHVMSLSALNMLLRRTGRIEPKMDEALALLRGLNVDADPGTLADAIVNAMPKELAAEVAQELGKRLANG